MNLCATLALAAIGATGLARADGVSTVISVADQMLEVVRDGRTVKRFPCSTSKYGIGDAPGSYRTPLGRMRVADKIGTGVPQGGKFHGRRFTGEVVDVGGRARFARDSILTRIIWLEGEEPSNRNAYDRCIYIHGTNQEAIVGKRPSSYGCIRMRNQDVLELFRLLPVGAQVVIQEGPLNGMEEEPGGTDLTS